MLELPNESKLFKSVERDSDARGNITSIVDYPVQNVSIIDSVKGSIRSNHFHKVDFHFMYVLEGSIDYFFKPICSKEVRYFKVLKGDTILSPANEIHGCYFPEFTSLVVSSGFPRDQETYEADTTRVSFLNDSNIQEFLEKYARSR